MIDVIADARLRGSGAAPHPTHSLAYRQPQTCGALGMATHDSVPRALVTAGQDIRTSGRVIEVPLVQQEQLVGDGFLLSGPRLEGYIPTPPHKRAKKSYLWQAGIGLPVTEVKTGKKFWLCRHCYDNPVPQPLYLVETDMTTPAI